MTLARTVSAVHPVEPQDRARADVYALIARLFYAAPDGALLDAISGSGDLDAAVAGAALPEAWGTLRRAAAEVSAEEASLEYDDTFIGVGKPEVMLFGSYYLSGFLHEKPLVRVRSDLAALGFARRAGVGEPEDHIAALADVMRQLILDETRAPTERDAAQQKLDAIAEAG